MEQIILCQKNNILLFRLLFAGTIYYIVKTIICFVLINFLWHDKWELYLHNPPHVFRGKQVHPQLHIFRPHNHYVESGRSMFLLLFLLLAV